ncbi:type II secretion system minor pseudopilin GspI [Rehaibacterium terrae]|jgi:general secretion pathway protein I|uniref:Type II secretion system protein I n=1 Tax=Rehaibacterium terrae TaxID=1341696 RepID=A0A7W7Y0K7_9GAMM|nr:type II secretion system minor pseudopilin GspI [Rehaibacterium terrae]MBB5015894.1 general secretion pathway protein I [Rehaibacterium terrae]
MRVAERQRGFTLLEVLVALAILAVAMLALVRTASMEAAALIQSREHTHAQWVASNAIAEARLARDLPAQGLREGEETLGGRRWHWQMSIAPTPTPGIRRLDVAVRPDGAREPVLVLTGFVGG